MKTNDILKHFGVPYVERHPSVSKSCYGLCCPFCGDNNYHLGIFKENGNYSCFKCGAKGSLFKLLQIVEGISYKEYQQVTGQIFENLSSPKTKLDSIFKKEEKVAVKIDSKIDMTGLIPVQEGCLTPTARRLVERFANERRFTWKIIEAYNCMYGVFGYFQGRLVVPIPDPINETDSIIVGLCGRDLTNMSRKKYLFNKDFQASKYMYFAKQPKMNESIVIVEGIFDVWAVYMETGVNAAATFGSSISKNQIYDLNALSTRLIYMPDADVKESKIMRQTSLLKGFSNVVIARCDEGQDPCSMNRRNLVNVIDNAVNFLNC